MSASISPYPKLQLFDNNGVPLAFGILSTYAAGTTTPLVTYTDSTGSVANTNPVVLDSAGRANVWLGAAAYKFVLQDTFSNVIWTVDNITSGFLQSTGSSLITYNDGGTGGVNQTVQSKLQQFPTVKDKGALGNGVADDSAAFLLANATGLVVVTPGNYVIGSSISITAPMFVYPGAIISPSGGVVVSVSNSITAEDHQIFSGLGGGSFTISNQAAKCRAAWFGILPQNDAATNDLGWALLIGAASAWTTTQGVEATFPAGVINTNGMTHSLSRLVVKGHSAGTSMVNNSTTSWTFEALNHAASSSQFIGFSFGQASGVTATAGGAVHLQGQACMLKDLQISNFPAAMFNGFELDGTVDTGIYDIIVSGAINAGAIFTNGAVDTYGNRIFAGGGLNVGFLFTGIGGFYVTAMNAFHNANTGFSFPSGTNQYVEAESWISDTSGSFNWIFASIQYSSFTNCWGSSQISTSVNTSASGFFITTAAAHDLTFTACRSLTNNSHGMAIDNGALNIIVNGFNAVNNGRSITGHGIFLGTATNITITGCQNHGQNGFGMSFNASTDFLVVSSNNNQGNSGGTINNLSTGTHNAIGTGANV